MKALLTASAASLALMMITVPAAQAQWRGDDGPGWGRSAPRCRIVQEWRHGVMRQTRVCRTAGPRWDRRSWGRSQRDWRDRRDEGADWDRRDRSRSRGSDDGSDED